MDTKPLEPVRTFRLANGCEVEMFRHERGWTARCIFISATADKPHRALKDLKTVLGYGASVFKQPSYMIRRLDDNETFSVSLFDGGLSWDGQGPTPRQAYEAAWRKYRVRNQDAAKLLEKIGVLQSMLVERHTQQVNPTPSTPATSLLRRKRHAIVVYIHHAVRTAWRDLNDEVKSLRRQLADVEYELGVKSELLRSADRFEADLREMVQKARANPFVAYQLPVPNGSHRLKEAIKVLLRLAEQSAEYNRRATAAEMRAEQWKATVERLQAEGKLDL